MARKTQNRPHGAIAGRLFGSFSGKTLPGHPVGVLTQNRPHGGIAGRQFGSFAGKGASGATYTLTAAQGTYTIIGSDALADYAVTAAQGSFVVTGQDASLLRTYTLSAAQGSYSLSGQDAAFTLGYGLTAESGTYAFSGQDAVLSYQQSGAITASSGTFLLTGQDVTFQYLRVYSLTAESGSYNVSGQAAALTYSADATPFGGFGNFGPSIRKKKRKPVPPTKTLREQLEETYEQLAAKPSVPTAVTQTADAPAETSKAEVQPATTPSAKLVAESDRAPDEAQELPDVAAEVRETLQVANQPILKWLAHINQNVTELHAKLDRMEEQRKQARRKAQHDLLLG